MYLPMGYTDNFYHKNTKSCVKLKTKKFTGGTPRERDPTKCKCFPFGK